MAVFKRRGEGEEATYDNAVPLTVALGATFVEDVDVLQARVGFLDAKIAELEYRVADVDEASAISPDHGDVIDVQFRTAKMVAELHLVTMELKAELARLHARIDEFEQGDDAASG